MNINRIGIILKKESPIDSLAHLLNMLEKHQKKVYFCAEEAENGYGEVLTDEEFYRSVDLILVLGGDGTLLKAAQNAALHDIPILGINFGHLGFLSELEKEDLQILEKMLCGHYQIEERMMLKCTVATDKETTTYYALNDVVISRGAIPRMIHFHIRVENQQVEDYIADGLILATPTGSTAYSLSAGGPIVEPDTDLMIATPICPHSLKARSMIIGGNRIVSIGMDPSYHSTAFISVDGTEQVEVPPTGTIVIEKAEYTTKLLRVADKNFYSILRQKLTERGV